MPILISDELCWSLFVQLVLLEMDVLYDILYPYLHALGSGLSVKFLFIGIEVSHPLWK